MLSMLGFWVIKIHLGDYSQEYRGHRTRDLINSLVGV